TWEPEDDARAGLENGRLTFHLHGEKLRGRWHLVKTRSGAQTGGHSENWLLFKGRDDAANDEIDILSAEPASVVSGRTIDEIAAAPERVWPSTRAALPTVAEKRAAKIAAARTGRPKAAANHNELLSLVAQLRPGFKLTNLDKVLYHEQGITK